MANIKKNFFNINKTPEPPEFMPNRNELVYQHNKTFVSAELIDIGTRSKVNYNEWITDDLNNGYWAPVHQNNGKFFKIRNDGTVEGYIGPDFRYSNNKDPFVYSPYSIRYKVNTCLCQRPAISGNKIYAMTLINNKIACINNGEVSSIPIKYINLGDGVYNFHTEPYVANDGTVYYCSSSASSSTHSRLLKIVDNTAEDILPYIKKERVLSFRDKNNNIYYVENENAIPNNLKTHVTKITPDNIITTNVYEFNSKYAGSIYDEKLDIHYLIPTNGKFAVLRNGILTKSDVDLPVFNSVDDNTDYRTILEISNKITFRDINDNIYLPQYFTNSNNTLKRVIKFSNGEISLVGDINDVTTYVNTDGAHYINPTTKAVYYPPSFSTKYDPYYKMLKIDYFTGNVSYINLSNTTSGTDHHLFYYDTYFEDQLGYVWYTKYYTKHFLRFDTGNDTFKEIFFSINNSYISSNCKPLYLDNGDIIIFSSERYIFKISYGEVSIILNNNNFELNVKSNNIRSSIYKPYMDKNRNYYYAANSKIIKITQSGTAQLINGENASYSQVVVQYIDNAQFMDKEKNFYSLPIAGAGKKILKIEYETGNISFIDAGFPLGSNNVQNLNNNKPYIDNNGNMYFTPMGMNLKMVKVNFN